MNLEDILNKTKNKSQKIKIERKPPSIATTDRPYSIQEMTDNKPTTNRQQTDNKPTTNRQQTDNKPTTSITTNWQQTDNKPSTKPTTELATNWQQTGNKLATNWQQKYTFSSLVGLQKMTIILLYDECQNTRSKITNSITIEYIANHIKCSKNTAKITLQRLELKGCLIRKEFKNGRGGWSKYELPEWLYHEMRINETGNKLATNWQQTGNKLGTQPSTQPTTSLSSSSSIILNTTTTTEATENFLLPIEWQEIDLSEFQKRNIPFGKKQIETLWSFLKIYSAFDFQESIDGFVYDIDNNHIAVKRGYLNFFIGIIRNGQLYVSSHYVSPERKKMNEMIELSQKKAQEKMLYLAKLEEEKFNQWIADYGEENIKNQLSPNLLIDFEHKGKNAFEWIKRNIYLLESKVQK